jgi:hypothetical protein
MHSQFHDDLVKNVTRSRVCRVLCRADKMCRDVISAPKADFNGEGKTFRVTFLSAGGDSRTIDVPDDVYILDAADENGIDLPATCRGTISIIRVSVEGDTDQKLMGANHFVASSSSALHRKKDNLLKAVSILIYLCIIDSALCVPFRHSLSSV